MSLADSLSDLPDSPKPGPRCSLGLLLEQLETTDPKGAKALRERLEDGTPGKALAAALHKAGHSIKYDTIRRHRRRATGNGCACP